MLIRRFTNDKNAAIFPLTILFKYQNISRTSCAYFCLYYSADTRYIARKIYCVPAIGHLKSNRIHQNVCAISIYPRRYRVMLFV